MKPKVIIIGIGFASRLGLIRAVAKTGADIDVVVVGHEKPIPIDGYSKFVQRIFYCKGNNQKRLLDILTQECISPQRKAVLIPANDFAASVLDKNLDILEKHFLLPHISHQQGAITTWMNKEKQKTLAQKAGIRTAKSCNIEIKNGEYQIP
jgi:predicted ATP-grasp superfamily ATP-dependent carboligase